MGEKEGRGEGKERTGESDEMVAAVMVPGCALLVAALSSPLSLAPFSRRAVLATGAAALFSAGAPNSASAAANVKDLTRLPAGLNEINYLLENWEKETTNPNSGDADPDRVRIFVGLRSTTSPLFQVEKLLAAPTTQDKVDPDRFDEWITATEEFNSHINKINELAYTSSFGEYHPGGGKDQVAKYLNLAKEEVVLARDSLALLIDLLGLDK